MKVLTYRDLREFKEVRLVTDEGNQIINIKEAFAKAEGANLDLVLVGDTAKPPVVRIQDFNKLQYEKKKREKEQRKKNKHHELKEVQFKPHIADGDLQIKVRRIDEFLTKGHKVKVVIRLRGRERNIPELGPGVISKIVEKVSVDHKVVRQKSPVPMVILEP